ncbi:hypothetical protein GYN07_28120 (plasmid) [Rhizobium leguminosarum bv. viciae 248]|nr:hypothetical protein [Rhizobium leguminosarum]MBY5816244.1 hypothetical protein [Rhizobium leguminosarum]QHW28178.1 hypothetical protein GYN07_28120 [Rhizobium leguminosarum bv. viciae 248]
MRIRFQASNTMFASLPVALLPLLGDEDTALPKTVSPSSEQCRLRAAQF